MLSEGLRRHHPHHSYKLGNGAHFASHGLAALSRLGEIEQGHCHEEHSRNSAGRALEAN
jgi:hypothetical protein